MAENPPSPGSRTKSQMEENGGNASREEEIDSLMPTGMVFNIQRASTEDGPGIRTTVFFKGCWLRCTWCHNPEGIEARPQVQWLETLCIDCHACIATCPHRALTAGPAGIFIDRHLCDGCGDCAAACPTGAMEQLGRLWTVADLVEEMARDAVYFDISGGGVTASGGEPALQAEFLSAVFRLCRQRGIATALDTCGQAPPENYALLLPHTDLVLFDIKLIDPERHRRHTGRDNRLILDNLESIATTKRQGWPGKIWIRTPIIPGATDGENNIVGIGRFLTARIGDDVQRWELCAFNNLCRDKYRRLGLKWPYENVKLNSGARMEKVLDAARSSGVAPDKIFIRGNLREPQESRGNRNLQKPSKDPGATNPAQ